MVGRKIQMVQAIIDILHYYFMHFYILFPKYKGTCTYVCIAKLYFFMHCHDLLPLMNFANGYDDDDDAKKSLLEV